jgi:Cof subfamily protein (haloacid dehalogenase superfamily)
VSIRLIAIDIDGTLLDSHGRVPDANISAIAEAVTAGVEVALVTGRSFTFARPVADALPDRLTFIVSNGAVVKRKDGETLQRRMLPREVAHGVLTGTRAFRHVAGLMFDRALEGQIVTETMDWDQPNRRGYFERNRGRIATVPALEEALTEDPIQVMFNGSVAPMRGLLEVLRGLPGAAEFEVALTEYVQRDFSLLDVLARGCSKGAALAEWAAHRGLTRDQVMAVGDNFNDLEMLEFAGLPVVMGNAVPDLKTRGWTVTGSNDEAGLGMAIRKFAIEPISDFRS